MESLPLFNFLSDMPTFAGVLGVLAVALALGFFGAALWVWAVAGAVALYGLGAPVWLWAAYGLLVIVLNVVPIRRALVTGPIMGFMRKSGFLPVISETEQVAIEAGDVWVESELFSGKPDFKRILAQPYPELSPEEQAFLDGPVEEVCRMTDDWDVTIRRDLPPEVWDYLRRERFFGMIIPKEYGGLGFSPLANSAVVQKLATRSIPLSITVMVPNSLGPAELLLHYGTPEQRDFYLPRLARGDEVPAFALTEPGAGSDAGGITASGVVFRGEDGKLYLRLNWRKRYITLASASTLLGLAFKLRDPDQLLGKGTDLGITCALIPTDTPGVVLGRRHDPLGIPFINSPTEGHDVVVPVGAIIGGVAGAGNGWRMLMESLAAGRGISLPAQAAGGAKYVARVASGHAAVRQQFGLSIGRFEGIEEPLARITGIAYLLEAARRYTCGGIATGAKPAVVTALLKYLSTELQRKVINDGMDVLGGNAISRGPRNLLANGYTAMPISITVEGANILTRTLMVFGQGAIRCHPYVYREIRALATGDARTFDAAFCSHVGHVVRNACRSLVLSLTRGWAASVPGRGAVRRYYRRMAWTSATFAFLADLAMATLGGNLKRKEKITGRFADVLAWMYIASSVLRRYEAEGKRKGDLPLVHWSMQYAFAHIQIAFDGLFENVQVPGLTWLFRGPVAFWSRLNPVGLMPSDRLGGKVARMVQTPGEQRDRITEGIYVPQQEGEALARLEHAFVRTYQSDEIARSIKAWVRSGRLPKAGPGELVEAALSAGLISEADAGVLREAEAAREDYIQVDAFPLDLYDRHFMPVETSVPTGDGGASLAPGEVLK